MDAILFNVRGLNHHFFAHIELINNISAEFAKFIIISAAFHVTVMELYGNGFASSGAYNISLCIENFNLDWKNPIR